MTIDLLLSFAFWTLLAVWPVVYVAYPVIVLVLARIRGPLVPEQDRPWPTVTVVVAAHNEAATIERCVRNCLGQEYPGEAPRIIVGLDGCTDGTAEILQRVREARLTVVPFARQGKAATHNALVSLSTSEVVVTTDAAAEFLPGSLEALVRPLRSTSVGCTSGVFEPRWSRAAAVVAEASYFALEYRLMRAESDLGILVKASGLVQAFRRSLWRELSPTSDTDISLPSLIAAQRRLVVFVPRAIALDDGPRGHRGAFRARRRMATQALANVPRHIWELARLGRWGPVSSLLFHKLLRWLAPWTAAAAVAISIYRALHGEWAYVSLLIAGGVAGLAALSGLSLLRAKDLSIVGGFIVSQAAFMVGAADVVRGARLTQWER